MSASNDDKNAEKSESMFPKPKEVVAGGLPLGPAKQVEVTLPIRMVVVLTTKAFSQLFGYAQATQ